MYQFKLPDLGEGIAEAEIVEWHVRDGDTVEEDQLLVEMMTDKAVMEIPSPRAGKVHRLYGEEGDVIPVGQVLIEIDDGAGQQKTPPGEPPTVMESVHAEMSADSDRTARRKRVADERLTAEQDSIREPKKATPKVQGVGRKERDTDSTTQPDETSESQGHAHHMPPRPHTQPVPVTLRRRSTVEAVPAVREFAKELGVDIEQVTGGTGPEGRVMRRDVEAFDEATKKGGSVVRSSRELPEESAAQDEPDWTREPLRRLRRQIAERVARSKTIIPHYTYVEEIDITMLENLRQTVSEATSGEKISPLAFIAHALTRVLPHYPQMNACMDEQTAEIIYKGKVHLGIAVATEAGLVVPVIRDATQRSVVQLATAIRDVSDRAHQKKLKLSEVRGSTITITSLGKLGGVMATPIINYPASAIIGVHAIRTLPRYVDNQIVEPRQIMNLSASLDHRIVDGFECAQFIQEVKAILELADFPEFKSSN